MVLFEQANDNRAASPVTVAPAASSDRIERRSSNEVIKRRLQSRKGRTHPTFEDSVGWTMVSAIATRPNMKSKVAAVVTDVWKDLVGLLGKEMLQPRRFAGG